MGGLNDTDMTIRDHLGYFEEFLLLFPYGMMPKGMGSKHYPVDLPVEQQGRPLGHAGTRKFVVTETITLQKGHREVTYRASPKKPLNVQTMLQRMEGKERRV